MAEGIETKALITAAEALSTKYYQTQILGINDDPKCHMCKETNEAVSQLLNKCAKLTTNNYLKRHSRNSSQEYMSELWD